MSARLADGAAALFAALEPGSEIGLAVFDADLRCRAASPSLLAADPIGRRAEDVLPAPVAPLLVAALAEVRDGPASVRRFARLRPDGADEPVYRTGVYRLAPDADGSPLLGLVTAEITERHRAQQRVLETRGRLELAERLGGLGAYTWWPQPENRWSWSEELLALAGFEGSPKAPPWAVWMGLVDPGDRLRVIEGRERNLAGEAVDMIVRQRRPDGTERVLRVIAVPHVAGGSVVRVDGVVQDVTEVERAAAQQRVVAELGRAALERLDVAELIRRACRDVARTLDAVEVAAHEAPYVAADDATCVVIPGPDEPWGALAVTLPPARDIVPEERSFLHAVANVLGSAIARSRLELELARQADARGRLLAEALDAEDRTRREISETLHDGPLQDLLALNQFVARIVPQDERAELHLERALTGLRRSITGLREVMLELHPVVLDVGGLDSALGAVAAQQGRAGGFTAEVRIAPDAGGLRDELVLSLGRELLVNAAKHAHARRVVVGVRRDGGRLVLEVADDGVGIPDGRLSAALRDGHVGLASTRQRVEAVGGRLDVDTVEGAGTRVTAVVPVP